MPLKRFVISICILLLAGITVQAQDSLRSLPRSTRYITEREINLSLTYIPIDTGLLRNEIFHPGFKKHIVFQDLGNVGTAIRPLLFTPEREAGFQYGFNPLEPYFIDPQNTRFYNTKIPYTDLFYAQGSNEVIFLQAKHAQNILPRWNAGLEYQRITSQGFYLKQLTSMYNYQFFTHYFSKNKRYELLAHAIWNKGVNEESGGIQSDSAFESLTGANKTVLVKLNNSQTRFKSRDGYIKQYVKFGNGGFTSVGEDSLYSFAPQFQLSHTLHAHEISFVFDNDGDEDSVLFPNRYYDTTSTTSDSAYYGKLSNSIELQYFSKLSADSMRLVFFAGGGYHLINTAQTAFTRFFYNADIAGGFDQTDVKKNKAIYGIRANYTVAGYNAGDYKLNGYYTLSTKWLDLIPEATIQQYRPDFTMQLFKANQFIWNNNFNPTFYTKTGGTLKTNSFKNNLELKVNYYVLHNLVYVNDKALPQQQTGTINILTAEVSKTFQLWKFFFEHQLIYQQTSDKVIRVPEFAGMLRYYFQSRLFKSTTFQLGFDVFYNTAYYGNAYNPATRLFYLQNSTKIGNYPLVDPFVCMLIKSAIVFAKYEHVNQDLVNSGFYYTPNYPVSLASFRMGVRWRMYN